MVVTHDLPDLIGESVRAVLTGCAKRVGQRRIWLPDTLIELPSDVPILGAAIVR